MPDTVKELIVALLDMPMNALVEADHPESIGVSRISAVSRVPNVAFGQQYVRLEIADA